MDFNLEYSAWWLLLIAICSAGLTYFSYSNKAGFKDLKSLTKSLFISFRFISLFLLGLLLLGIILNTTKERIENPIFFVVTDNSKSMLNYKDSSSVKKDVLKLKSKLKQKFGNVFRIKELTIGSDIDSERPINFTEANSNLERAFEYINTEYYNRNIGGIAFISDGNFNVGANPIYNAEKIQVTPIFALSVGDSIQKRDHLIKNIFNNNIAFLNNEFPVEIDISAYKMNKESVTISIEHKNKIIAKQKYTYSNENQDFKKIRFNLLANQLGFQSYKVHLEEKTNEISLKNNHKNFYVEVLDSRNKVLILSGAPHPDISSIRGVLSTDDNIELEYSTFQEWNRNCEKINLIICHNPNHLFTSLFKDIKNKKVPVLFILGSKTHKTMYSELGIQYKNNAAGGFDNFQGSVNMNFSTFEFGDDLVESLEYYPPIHGKYGDFTIPNGSSIFIKQRIGPVIKKNPLFFFSGQQGFNYGVIMGEGIWRWRFNEYQRKGNHNAFNGMVSKAVQFLTVKKRGKGLNVIFPRRLNKEEDLIINANFYNSAMEPITKPQIKLEITGEDNKRYESQFAVNAKGYQAKLGQLNPGKYDWLAQTKFDGKLYTQKGSFIVEDLDKEKSESVANHNVLKQLAIQSNGKFYSLSDSKSFISDLSKRKDISSLSYEEKISLNLIESIWYLLTIAVFLVTEWILKRYHGIA